MLPKKKQQQFWPLIILAGSVAMLVMLLAVVGPSGQLGAFTWGSSLGGSTSTLGGTTSTLGGTTYSTWGGFGGFSAPTINKDPTDELPKDWEEVNTVGVTAALNTECNTCPSPSPTPRSLSSETKPGLLARVLGERVALDVEPSTCIRGKQGPAKNTYTPRVIREVHSTEVNGSNAVDIMETICGDNSRVPDGCPVGTIACAWEEYGSSDFTVNLNGLVEKDANDNWHLVSGFVFPECLGSQQSVSVPAVYPVAPPGEEIVFVNFDMGLWTLSGEDVRKLKAANSELLKFAQDVLANTKEHESRHWKIYEDFVPVFFGIMNDPPVPGVRSSRAAIRRAIGEFFDVKWGIESDNHDWTQDNFHDSIIKAYRTPPGKGLEHIRCRFDTLP